MMFNPHKTHIIPTVMLFAAAMLPVHPLATNSAYRDTEVSTANSLKASDNFGPRLAIQFDEIVPESFTVSAFSLEGDVAGTSTASTTPESKEPENPKVEVSDEPLIIETGTSTPEVTISDEPLEVVEPALQEEPQEEESAKEPEEESKPEQEQEEAPEPQEEAPAPEEPSEE